jgi:hypothetical protein
MGPLQAMDRSTVAVPPRKAPTSGPASRGLRVWLLALVALLALATGLAPLLRGGAGRHGAAALSGDATPAGVPATARAQVSAALGAAEPEFRVSGSGGSLHAANLAQGLSASFSRSGARLTARGIDVGLSLREFGAAGSLRAVAQANPTAHANRVSYARGGALSEWYANGPAGLEQGFTILRAPAHAATAPLTLALTISGARRVAVATDGRSLAMHDGAHELRYGGLVTTDARDRALRSRLTFDRGRLLIRVDAAHARYPLRIDPLIEAGDKLTGGGEEGEGLFGASVALSADGATLLVGGPHDTNADHGAAWVFTRSGSTWVQQGLKLIGAEGTPPAETEEAEQCAEEAPEEAGECAFGASVALSADGDTALIGEPSATARPGAAWVFKRTGTGAQATWTKATILTGEGASGEGRFGKSVALSADGSTALIGDPSASSQRGGAWVFALSGASATVQGRLADPQAGHFDHVGRSVALSGDGDTALVGAPGDSEYVGAALVFTRAGETWSRQQGKLTGEAERGAARFGKSVALSGDGQTALVGGQNDDENHGAAWGFARAGESFAPQGGKLVGAEAIEAHFGASVALSGDGGLGLVGAPRGGGGGEVTEVVHSGSSWTSPDEVLETANELGKGWLGGAVALSSEGTLAAVGAPHDHARAGAAWVFAEPPIVAPSPPTVTRVLPGFGPAGAVVRVEGSGLQSATKVWFGSVPAEFKPKSGVKLEATAPAGVGVVDVTVQTGAGVSAVNAGDTFRFTTGKTEHGGAGNEDPGGGGVATTTPEGPPGTTGATPSASGTGVKASGGVLASTSAAPAACRVTLRSKRLAVTSYRTVALRLLRTGAGACSGKLTLSFKLRPKGKRAMPKAIGTASYSLSSGTSKVFKITLNQTGRKLFRAHRGKLNVSLAIVRAVPAPRLAMSASVRLTWKKTRKALTLTR